MIPVTQTKVVIKDSNGNVVQNGNCFPAVIASILEVPITEVPNVEVFYHIKDPIWYHIMCQFLESHGWELNTDLRFKVFHDDEYGVESNERSKWIEECRDKLYFVSGVSDRGVHHITIWKNGEMVHDPHPSRDGITTHTYFEYLSRKS